MTNKASDNCKVLLVEGQDDKHVVEHIAKRIDSAPSFEVLDREGVDKLIKGIGVEIMRPRRVAVGLVLDANDNLEGRWRSVSNELRSMENDFQVKINLPSRPCRTGTIVEGTLDAPRIGIWLMPDNGSPGELEDFVQQMIPKNDPVWPLARRYIQSIPNEAREFPESKIRKAEIRAWLATRAEPGLMGMGSAIGKRDLEISGNLCVDFINWLHRLFGSDVARG